MHIYTYVHTAGALLRGAEHAEPPQLRQPGLGPHDAGLRAAQPLLRLLATTNSSNDISIDINTNNTTSNSSSSSSSNSITTVVMSMLW